MYTKPEVYEYVSKQTNDPIVEWKTCEVSGTKFPVYKSDMEFYDKISPVFEWKKYMLPTPNICPEERQRNRLMFRNEWNLYRRKCDATGENIISIYSPDKPYKVYSQEVWWSDKWDWLDYGQDVSFSEPIFSQLDKLRKNVPLQNVVTVDNENCDYTTGVGYSKNCYLINSSENSENCYYGKLFQNCKNSVDCSYVYDSDFLYQCVNVKNSFNCTYLENSQDCNNCHYSEDLVWCNDCMFCSWLRNAQYCFDNQKLTKEEYELKIDQYLHNANNIKLWIEKFEQVRKNKIARYANVFHSEKTFGDYVSDDKNCVNCYDVDSSEDCRYINVWVQVKSIMDGNNIYLWSEKQYNVLGTMWAYNVIFSTYIFDSSDIIYSRDCHDCKNCFWCMWLKNKQYCILNKQYTKEEYETLVPQIIEYMQSTWERGRFFDDKLAPYGYNESLANEYFPLTREKAMAKGYKRQDNNYDPVVPDGVETLKWDQISNDISSVTDDIVKKIFICEVTNRPFRIVKQELEFYRKMNLPLPRKHADIRYKDRLKTKAQRQLHLRKCDKCWTDVVSVYGQEVNFDVYCQNCYNKEIYL